MKIVLKFLLFFVVFIVFSPDLIYSTFVENDTQVEKLKASKQQWEMNYEKTIWFIKSHEGFNYGMPYFCPAGYFTIGYGHIIQSNESFDGQISEKQADRLLRKDFDLALKMVEESTNIYGNKKLAMAHFVYALGIGRFNGSKLRQLVQENKSIEDEILNFCYYKLPTGKMIRSEYAYKLRKWELDMYNSN